MATNQYIKPQQGYQSEQDLYEEMIIENIQISGLDFIYIPRTLSESYDQIFGEDVLSSFKSHAVIEMYLDDYQGYGGESEMISKFGLNIIDTATFIISRKRYQEVVTPIVPDSRNEVLKLRPCEGDLIYAPFSKSLMEVKFVEDEAPGFYQLNKKFVWSLRCELVQINNEKFETGNTEIDDMFGRNLNRLDNSVVQEDEFTILCEDGGYITTEEYVVSKPYDEMLGYGDDTAIKKEFLEIMDFDESSPFNNERF